MRELAYLASPYYSLHPYVCEQRFRDVASIGAQLMQCDIHVLCPITMCHPMAESVWKLPGHFDFWKELDENLISRCDYMLIAAIPGWTESAGIKREIYFASQLNKRIQVVHVDASMTICGITDYKGECDA